MTTSGRQPPARPVGRDAQSAALAAALQDTGTRCRLAVVTGEAGIGKSLLLETLATRALADGDQVLRGECTVVSAEPLPYAAIVAALRSGGATPSGVPAAQRSDLFENILATLVRLRPPGRRQVLLLEDLQWVDATTSDLSAFLVHNLPADHLVVLTRRSDEIALDPAAHRVLDTVCSTRDALRIDLQRLTEDELRQLFGQSAARLPGLDELQALWDRTGGNPYMALELIEAGSLYELPDRLSEVLTLRAAHLSATGLEVTRTVAVAGRSLLQHELPLFTGVQESEALTAVREAIDAGVLVVDRTGDGYTFRHALMQEALIGWMLPGERQRIHRRIAQALDDDPRIRHSASSAAEWSAHWRASGDQVRAFEVTAEAAKAAGAAFAHSGRWRQYRFLVQLLADGYGPAEQAARGRLLAEAAEAARWAGQPGQAVELGRRAASLLDDPTDRAHLYERLGRALWDNGSPQEAATAYERADQLAREVDEPALRARITASRARLAIQGGRYTEAIEAAELAITLAASGSAPAEDARARAVLGMCEVLTGEIEEGLAELRRAQLATARWGDDEDKRRLAGNLAFCQLLAGDARAACETAVHALAEARRQNPISGTGAALVSNTVVLLSMTGRWPEAIELSDEAIAEGVDEGQALLVRLARAELDLERGELADASRHLEAAGELVVHGGTASISADLALARSRWAWASGDRERAFAEVDAAWAALQGTSEWREMARTCALALRWCAEARGGRRAGPDRRRDRFLAAAVEIGEGRPTPEVRAYLATAMAENSRVRGDGQAAAWSEAVIAWGRIGRIHEEAYARFRLGESLLGPDRSQAVIELTTALEVATQLGARPLRDSVDDVLRRARVRRSAAAVDGDVTSRFQLTRRESEVLMELATGLTNKQIAARLYLSPRTVDVHVANVLMKLGVRTRVEAASLLATTRHGSGADSTDGDSLGGTG
ncbi:MAG: AAA family ATPase [Nakamurella sp.]